MRRIAALLGLLLGAVAAQAGPSSCEDALPHVMNFAVPRTSLAPDIAQRLPKTLADLVQPRYLDPCGKNKKLQIHLAFGSDYEVLDWIERGSVDGGIVPDLSLWLLKRDENPLHILVPEVAAQVKILRPLTPRPSCRQYTAGRWAACSQSAEETYAALLSDIAAGNGAGARRVMFASHLSSTGFLAPIKDALKVFSDTKRSDEAQEELWNQLFAVSHFVVDSDPHRNPFELARLEGKTKPQALTVVSFPGEETLARDEAAPAAGSPVYHEHLVVASSAAEMFTGNVLDPLVPDREAKKMRPVEQPAEMGGVDLLLQKEHLPRTLDDLARVDPSLGVRSYAFTIRESLRLVEQQQRSSAQKHLALVLPGGGVKAAYQSRIIDYLYGGELLRNADLGEKEGSLEVKSVLGTSGGALLGYFVSQLGEHGPFDLTGILWKPGGRTLQARDVFGFTDMLRYLSIVWTFLVFCVLLSLVSGTYGSHFYERSRTEHASWRWRLMTVFVVFLAVPILIRFATGGDEVEHVPLVEGLFYSILAVVVMFCDQCLVYTPEDDETRPLSAYVFLLAVTGGLFVVLSFFGRVVPTLREPVTMSLSFATLSVIFLGIPMLILYAARRLGDWRRQVTDITGSLVVVFLLCLFGVPGILPEGGHIFALLLLIVLAVSAYGYSRLRARRRFGSSIFTFLTLLLTAVLCWPEGMKPGRPSLRFLTADALDMTPLASFLASIGCLLLVLAAAVWVYQRRDYALKNDADFSAGLAVLIGHAVITGVLVYVLTRVLPGRLHNVEVTPSFWISITMVGGLVGAIILIVARYWPTADRAIRFLTSEHPNGSLVPRRYARMLAVAMVSVVWWNFMIAPALYGNRVAQAYLKGAVGRFDAAFKEATPQDERGARGFVPTAKLVAPANSLDGGDATRYFLFLPEKNKKGPALPRRVAGAEWKVYETTSTLPDSSNCINKVGPRCVEFVQNVIFSSGSPFPIFAAHRMNIPGETGTIGLIDGGYSNVIPIDAARMIEARQALIVHSSSPFDERAHKHTQPSWLSRSLTPGMLIRNVTRLPAFMFERGQQVDRVSRQNLFVVGLSPKLKPGKSWPGLAQFDKPTVDYLIETAGRNLHERIGFVESWGEPRFRFSDQVPPDAPPATKEDPASPPPAPPEAH